MRKNISGYTLTYNGQLYYFSVRKTQCLFYLSLGYTTKEIGKLLHISPRTVETYLDQIRFMFGCRNKIELVTKLDLKEIKNLEAILFMTYPN